MSGYVCFSGGWIEQRRIEMGIAEIKAWIVMFMLMLNYDKAELVIIATPYFLQQNKCHCLVCKSEIVE